MSATPPKPAELAEKMAVLSVDDSAENAKWEAPDGWWTRWSGDDVPFTIDEKVAMALGVAKGGECIKDGTELKALFERKAHPVAYDGFEPSGRMHIAQGLLRSMNVNRLTGSGVKFVFWVADYFALMNLKLGGDINKIQDCGRYMIEVWRACGMKLDNVEFVWASEFINRYSEPYWFNVLQIAMQNSIKRIKRCGMIMGREASDELASSQVFYPCMQCNDVFQLKCDITSLGIDQRKVNMLAREYCDVPDKTGLLKYLGKDPKGKSYKPVILSHHMLAGLTGVKMSKSDPDSAIFMEDTVKDVNRKVKKAWCPPGVVTETGGDGAVKTNGCLEYLEYIVFPKVGSFKVERSDANGGDTLYTEYAALESDFRDESLHPSDLKKGLAAALNALLEPVRAHFTKDPVANELLGKMKRYMDERAAAAKQGKKKSKGSGAGGAKKGKGAAAGPAPIFDLEDDAVISCLDIRVGFIKKARLHPDPEADGTYVEDVDLGEEDPRQVCSRLAKLLPLDKIAGPCIVVCNLKPMKVKGVGSAAMILACVSEDGASVELLQPPPGAPVGSRVAFEDIPEGKGGLASPNQLNKGKGKAAREGILGGGGLAVSAACVATWRGHAMTVEWEGKEPASVTVPSLAGAKIK